MIITAIKPQRNQKRVNIYLDGKFAFGLDLENYLKLGLKVDQELTEAEVEEIIKKAELQKTLDKLLRFAALRPRSEKEIEDYLRRKKIHQSLYKELFNRLKRLELVDDVKFAKWWLEQRLAFRPKAKRILSYELRIKGVKKEIIDQVLAEVKIDEEKIASELLRKKRAKWERDKAVSYLARKGFSWEVIDQAIAKVVK